MAKKQEEKIVKEDDVTCKKCGHGKEVVKGKVICIGCK